MLRIKSLLLLIVAIIPCTSFTFPLLPATNTKQCGVNDDTKNYEKNFYTLQRSFVATLTALTIGTFVLAPLPATAAESRLIGQIAGSGLVFKDTLNVESFDDPKVRGVTLYISNFQRPLTERLSKDFFNDPSYASVGCARTTTKPIEIADTINTSPQGEQVFEESKSLLFKTLRVQRIYDKEKNTVVYVSFNTRLDKNEDSNKSRFKSSICAVNLE